jgi:lambda repressor-like predicted transcriptional regulator
MTIDSLSLSLYFLICRKGQYRMRGLQTVHRGNPSYKPRQQTIDRLAKALNLPPHEIWGVIAKEEALLRANPGAQVYNARLFLK